MIVEPYSVLAAGYDLVMQHVDYEDWALYIHDLICRHVPGASRILEQGCGTGSLALELQPMGSYRYHAADASPAMVAVARGKAELMGAGITFSVSDFTDFGFEESFDVILLLHDGLNYILEPEPILDFLNCAYEALRPGGCLIFDQSTPRNSINNEGYFDDEGAFDLFSYVRRSRYDHSRRLHTTDFEIAVGDERYRERHVQRAYEMEEIQRLIDASRLERVEALEDLSEEPATPASERIHWILQRPT